MELDVHLSRSGDEPWGFRLIGGSDYGMPLTVVKVLPDSPASAAGLQNGDTVLRIHDDDASAMTHAESRAALGKAASELVVGVARGLYDPVLDDYEPIYEPIDQEDFDQPSQPTEVQFQIKNFTDDPNVDIRLPEYEETTGLPISRSITASPFVMSPKPYRPFSTEPIPPTDVPPLEDPIILNPKYHDNFGVHNDDDEFLPKTKFKLPISEQYDPDGTKKKRAESKSRDVVAETKEINIEGFRSVRLDKKETFVDEVKKEIEFQQNKECSIEEVSKDTKLVKSEIKSFEKVSKDTAYETISSTAVNIVDDSIEKAMIVTQEIKNEIDVELRASQEKTDSSQICTTETTEQKAVESKVEEKARNEFEESVIEASQQAVDKASALKVTEECVYKKDQTTEETTKQNSRKNSVDVSKQVKMFEKVLEEAKEAEKYEATKKEDSSSIKYVGSQHKTDVSMVNSQVHESRSDYKSEMTANSASTNEKRDNKSKMSTARLLAEQRAYTIGLQTIPHIRGSVHSSYHYNLLLKTFFIHLTDVMVALSRFILTEPAFSEDVKHDEGTTKEETVISKEKTINSVKKTSDIITKHTQSKSESSQEVQDVQNETAQASTIVSERKDKAVDNTTETKITQKDRSDLEVTENTTTRKLSGSKMAQLTERKSSELTGRMDAVITEFQTKAGKEETVNETTEVSSFEKKNTSDQSKLTQEILNQSTKEVKSFDSTEISTESKQERKESKRKEREGKQTYVAIVESHVYTNQDTVLEDHQFSGLTSETASVQSPNETFSAVDISEAFDTTKTVETTLKNKDFLKKEAQSSQIAELISIENKSTTQKHEVYLQEKAADELVAEKTISETCESKINIQEAVVQTEKVKEFTENAHSELTTYNTELSKSQEVIIQEVVQPLMDREFEQKSVQKAEEAVSSKESLVSDYKVKSQLIEATKSSVAVESSTKKDLKIEHVKQAEKVETIETVQELPKVKLISEMKSLLENNSACTEIMENTTHFEVTQKNAEVADKVFTSSEETREFQETEGYKSAINETSIKTEHFEVTQKVSEVSNQILTSTEIKTEEKEIKEKVEEESADLKIIKEEIVNQTQDVGFNEETKISIKQQIENQSQDSQIYETLVSSIEQRTFDSVDSNVQESSFTAKSVETTHYDPRQLTLDLKNDYPIQKLKKTDSESSVPSEIDTPTPSHVPPTPITDEYVFKLEIPLPRSRGGTPYPCEPSSEPEPIIEDPHIVKKKLVPHIDTTIESKIFDPPLPSPPEDKVVCPVYTKPGLRGGGVQPFHQKEEIREIERTSSLLASAIDETIRNIEQYKQQVATEKQQLNTESSQKSNVVYNGFAKIVETKVFENGDANSAVKSAAAIKEGTLSNITATHKEDVHKTKDVEVKDDELKGYRPVEFNPDEIVPITNVVPPVAVPPPQEYQAYKTETGDVIGSHQGIVDGLDKPMVDLEVAKELGKPGMTEDKIAELISGESEMLREAHVMGLSRVLKSHMHRTSDDDSSVDFKKIKPILSSLKDSEVLKALNDEIAKTKEVKKKEVKKWTTFLQKPSRPVPKAKFGYPGWTKQEEVVEPYKVKIVKQPKPKVAPDYKPEDFNTGLLPWEERARNEPPPPPVEPEQPILIPEEDPEFLEAVDPTPESEVPDLEDTGIPLPPPPTQATPAEDTEVTGDQEPAEGDEPQELDIEAVVEETERIVVEMEQNRIADQLMSNVQNMVDPNAPLEQQLKQMQAQIAALAQLPCVIQQTLELVTRQLGQITATNESDETQQEVTEVTQEVCVVENGDQKIDTELSPVDTQLSPVETKPSPVETKSSLSEEEMARLKMEEREMLDEQQRIEKQKKELMDQMKVELNGRQIKQRSTPRVGKPTPMFGPLTPQERPLVLPGGRKWRKPQDAYNEQFIAETLAAQAEIIQGKAKGLPYESPRLPYDERINFMKYEKPPVSLDHLQHSDTYKLVHNLEQEGSRRLESRTQVMCEADYRQKCRSMTPSTMEQCINIP